MATLKSFATPDVLRNIAPGCLLELLEPHRSYFEGCGFPLPQWPAAEDFNYRQLALVLLASDGETPADLIEAIHVIGNMGVDERIDDLLQIASLRGIDTGSADIAPIDLATRVWLKAPKDLEKLERDELFQKKLKFEHFRGPKSGGGVAPEDLPEDVAQIESELDAWFLKNKRGAGCRIDRVVSGTEVRFIVEHGLPCRRERNRKGRESSPLVFRPEKADIVVCDFATDELRVHASTLGEMRLYVAAFGRYLFGDDKHFTFTAKYTLAPLQRRGRDALSCKGIEGLESIRLRELQWAWDGAFKHVETQRASDLLMAFALRRISIPQEPKIIKAVFEVKLTGVQKPRLVTIKLPATASFGRGGEAALIEQWLLDQKFVIVGVELPNEKVDAVMAGV
jgi:hypothetical protein